MNTKSMVFLISRIFAKIAKFLTITMITNVTNGKIIRAITVEKSIYQVTA